MATPEQIKANQSNAQHSTGPVTPEGKAASARNHTKHGLRGLSLILSEEDKAEYDQLSATLKREFRPEDFTELRIVREMTDAEFRLTRCRDLMHIALRVQMEKLHATSPELSALELEVRAIETLGETGCAWSTWLRYEAQYQREFRRAHKDWTEYKNQQQKTLGFNMDVRHYRREQAIHQREQAALASNVSTVPQPVPPTPELASNVPNSGPAPAPPHQKAA